MSGKECFALDSAELAERLRSSFRTIQLDVIGLYGVMGATQVEIDAWRSARLAQHHGGLPARVPSGNLRIDDPGFRLDCGEYLAGIEYMANLCGNVLNDGHSPSMTPVVAAWEGEIALKRVAGWLLGIHLHDATMRRDANVVRARNAANALHDQPGGSRDKQEQIRDLWASGKYTSRDLCAEQECAALDMSFSAARKALRNTPEPSRRVSKG